VFPRCEVTDLAMALLRPCPTALILGMLPNPCGFSPQVTP